MAVAAHIVPVRRRVRDVARVANVSTPGGRDGHTHCLVFNADGDGQSSPGPDGHVHDIVELEVLMTKGHTHAISGQRCVSDHNARANHVRPRGRDAR